MAYVTAQVLGLLVTILVAYKISQSYLRSYRIRRNGCAEPPCYPHKDPFLGLDLFGKYMDAFKSETFLDFNKQMFDRYGRTFKSNVLGTTTYRSIDPELSKAVFTTYASKFGLEPMRYNVANHLWGNGIIVVDGERWKHARALMRPSFEVVHLANFERLEKHTATFMKLLPSDGTTVDIMPLFLRLVCVTLPSTEEARLMTRTRRLIHRASSSLGNLSALLRTQRLAIDSQMLLLMLSKEPQLGAL